MQLGLIGLGRMGGNMRERLRRAGHEVVGYDRNLEVSDVRTLAAMVKKLQAPRVVWVMVPAGAPTRETVGKLGELLNAGDLVIDGGNSRFTDDVANAAHLAPKGIGYVDCGVSGGIWGLENGYGLMAGGDRRWIQAAMPIFDALRPEGERALGFVHAGKVGAGHYAKMVHNGIEYALMHAYGEGYELLEKKDIVTDVPGCFKAWSRGTVVRSWLLDLLVAALEDNPALTDVSDYTNDSGEGRWTVEEAIDNAVPMPVIAASLFARFASRQRVSPTLQAVAALRGQFGGHAVMTSAEGRRLLESEESPGAKASPPRRSAMPGTRTAHTGEPAPTAAKSPSARKTASARKVVTTAAKTDKPAATTDEPEATTGRPAARTNRPAASRDKPTRAARARRVGATKATPAS
ncbi:MAG: decarboxylating 6-phosphogluconate dehydrogenase [Dermatophilaceae bacterium]